MLNLQSPPVNFPFHISSPLPLLLLSKKLQLPRFCCAWCDERQTFQKLRGTWVPCCTHGRGPTAQTTLQCLQSVIFCLSPYQGYGKSIMSSFCRLHGKIYVSKLSAWRFYPSKTDPSAGTQCASWEQPIILRKHTVYTVTVNINLTDAYIYDDGVMGRDLNLGPQDLHENYSPLSYPSPRLQIHGYISGPSTKSVRIWSNVVDKVNATSHYDFAWLFIQPYSNKSPHYR